MSKREVKMLGDICPRCMRTHAPPACDYDPDRPCPECGLMFGWSCPETDASGKCWWCTWNYPRPSGPPRPKRSQEFEF